ncbi:unnamed protein product [Didymodactylos carnosus]|uniref:Uncharacterized protein n=1 Tax=Didymodactylos carnosus TaxID=1234261 RepID=A0A815ZGV9_9BILA|nr:unnamed protein product [Didymodactylos carnosus]CAF1582631.1 unnamed protein product [Didymodactylos carnosus]CAF4212883.1 unnamed protein product [Didymodactylos carnosus]CAF4450734.1 unnamed protein product [Didymodactylos carnosus]
MNFDDEVLAHVCILGGLKEDLLLKLTGDTICALKADSNTQSTNDGKDSGITDEKLSRFLDSIKYINCGLNELPIVNTGREDYLCESTVLGGKDNDGNSKIFVYQYAIRKIYNYEKRLIIVIIVNLIADDTKQYIFQYEGNDIYYNRMVSAAKDIKMVPWIQFKNL